MSLTAGRYHSFALCSDGSVYAWGDNAYGGLGLGDDVERDIPTLVSALSDKDVISLTAGSYHSLALRLDGSVYAWGYNYNGELGAGVTRLIAISPRSSESLSDKDVISLTAGSYHSFALCSDGSVYAWGNNDHGQLGLGDDVDRITPTLVGALSDKDLISITAGSSHYLALCSDDSVYAWGVNGHGQLGLGDYVNRDIPTLVTFP
ncbi:MAG: hypothetical protein U5N86_04670 [Planctomycetota bacterium]|nr:hypothetical protein [Planctomycetota bacterium]